MATDKPRLTVFLTDSEVENFKRVAGGAHLTAPRFAALLVAKFSHLKPEFALDAITAIPKDYFRSGPGRPQSRNSTEIAASGENQLR